VKIRTILIAGLIAGLPASVHGQETRKGPTPAQVAAYEARRDSLENEVVGKFVDRMTRDLKLTPAERTQVEKVLAESGTRRHELLKASSHLRGRMRNAMRDAATTDAAFLALISEQNVLRDREHQLWVRDQEAMARILKPRQRVYFLTSWSTFQEDMRRIVADKMNPRSNDQKKDEHKDEHREG
jgi:Spy/CpxP family protein refolding chaperone